MYDIEYACSYMDDDFFIETDEINDAEKDFIRNCIYRQDLLNIFQLEIFDEHTINTNISKIYKKVNVNDSFMKCILLIGQQHGLSNDMSFLILFSFDYLYLTHKCIVELLNTGHILPNSISQLCLKISTPNE